MDEYLAELPREEHVDDEVDARVEDDEVVGEALEVVEGLAALEALLVLEGEHEALDDRRGLADDEDNDDDDQDERHLNKWRESVW